MHIPDGFLDAKTWISAAALSAGAISYSVKKSREELNERQVPRLGIMAAFIFAAQMINFPIGVGVSGHLLGAALATVLLGPWNACLIISTILIIQCIGFQDGGLTALGGNIFNMAVVGVLIAFLVHSIVTRVVKNPMGRNIAVFLAAWVSVLASSSMAAVEIFISGTVPLSFAVLFSAVTGWHALIGVGEGLITLVVVNFARKIGFIDVKSGIRDEVSQ